MVSWKNLFFGIGTAALALSAVAKPLRKINLCEAPKENEEGRGPIIGIDLGTTFSCVEYLRDSGVQTFSNDQGNRIIPSWVAVTAELQQQQNKLKRKKLKSPNHNACYLHLKNLPWD